MPVTSVVPRRTGRRLGGRRLGVRFGGSLTFGVSLTYVALFSACPFPQVELLDVRPKPIGEPV